jgi:hypothetical protein
MKIVAKIVQTFSFSWNHHTLYFFVKNVQFFKGADTAVLHMFSRKLWGKNKFPRKVLRKQIILRRFMQKLIFLRKSAEVSCHQNIFTKVVPLFHIADKFCIFIINVRKSQHLLISVKVFVSILPPSPHIPVQSTNPPPSRFTMWTRRAAS